MQSFAAKWRRGLLTLLKVELLLCFNFFVIKRRQGCQSLLSHLVSFITEQSTVLLVRVMSINYPLITLY